MLNNASENKFRQHLVELSEHPDEESFSNVADPTVSLAGLCATLTHIDARIAELENKLAKVTAAKPEVCKRLAVLARQEMLSRLDAIDAESELGAQG
jgi:hypothetical protein